MPAIIVDAADTENVIEHLLDMARSLTRCAYEPMMPTDATILNVAAALLRRGVERHLMQEAFIAGARHVMERHELDLSAGGWERVEEEAQRRYPRSTRPIVITTDYQRGCPCS